METGTTFLSKESAFQKLICPYLVTCPNAGAGTSLSAVSERPPARYTVCSDTLPTVDRQLYPYD
jgi:hypothetical protein